MAVDEPAGGHLDDLGAREDIAKNVRTLMENRGVSLGEVAKALGLSKPSVSQRLHAHTPFTGEQLTTLAVVLRVEPSVFFVKPEDLLKSRCLAPALHVVDPAPGQLMIPKLDPPDLTVVRSSSVGAE